MARETPWEDEYTLLCERCGYVIEGLATDANCPECGRPIEDSLPERRPGTAYQNNPSFANAWGTSLRTLLHPIMTLDEIRYDYDPGDDNAMGIWHAVLTGTLITASIMLYGVLWLYERLQSDIAVWAMLLILIAGVGVVFLAVYIIAIAIRALTVTEATGLRIISSRRGFRITPRIATLVTAHGSVGWTAGALLGLHAFVGLDLAGTLTDTPPLQHAAWIALAASMLIGFLFFETFAWLGLRRLKYANTPRQAEESDGPVARAPGS